MSNLAFGTVSFARALLLAGVALVSACTYTASPNGDLGAPPDSIPFGDDDAIETTTPPPETVPVEIVPVETVPPAPTTSTVERQSCVGRIFSINYPDTWYTGGPPGREADCVWLSRSSLAGVSSEDFVAEISFASLPHYGDALKDISDFEENKTVLVDSYAANFNSFPSTVFDIESAVSDSEGEENPSGARSRIVVIDIEGRALVVTATEATTGEPGVYEDTIIVQRELLDSLYPIS